VGRRIQKVRVRQPSLRWPVPTALAKESRGQEVVSVERRAKYLLFGTDAGTAIAHLGMSGSMRILKQQQAAGKHDHLDVEFDNGTLLRFTDPRRFGAWLWTRDDPLQHPLLAKLGPEPLLDGFDGDYLYRQSRGRQLAVKSFIMNAAVVVGVGNIYASEALFLAGIHPSRAAKRISRARYNRLADHIRETLALAIEQGGTTLKDFVGGDGQPGYFTQFLNVYDRAEKGCPNCGQSIRKKVIGQRSSFFCNHCQK
jgi:formamidopyrimidine-DNA glycosylase